MLPLLPIDYGGLYDFVKTHVLNEDQDFWEYRVGIIIPNIDDLNQRELYILINELYELYFKKKIHGPYNFFKRAYPEEFEDFPDESDVYIVDAPNKRNFFVFQYIQGEYKGGILMRRLE